MSISIPIGYQIPDTDRDRRIDTDRLPDTDRDRDRRIDIDTNRPTDTRYQ